MTASIRHCAISVFAALLCQVTGARAQAPLVPPYPGPDERFKADILLVVAHPDDETAVGSYLAKVILDDGRRVAIIYCNRGDGGGNSHGAEQSHAMGAIREIEARRAASTLGISNVWFLDGRDTPGQDLFQSLEHWGHGSLLEQVVRLVRLTRPEVVLTWLPHFVSGENHGDHQAAGVIATEAFDIAADPTVFPAQVAPARERNDIGNATEGLHPWQPKKIYYFSDASHPVDGDGPAFDITGVSRTRKVPYYVLAADLHLPHRTQGDVAEAALEAKRTGNYEPFKKWLGRFKLLFGKSVVPASPRGDTFEGVSPSAAPFTPPPGYRPVGHRGITLELGGAFAFYRDFWRAHGIERVGPLINPEITVAARSYLQIPLLIRNSTADTVEVTLVPDLPKDWEVAAGAGRYRVAPGEAVPAQTILHCPPQLQEVTVVWKAVVGGTEIGACSMAVTLAEWTLPQ